jgi:hypothetical protein
MQDSVKFLGKINFPKPQNIIINMMPFIIGDIDSIPDEYKHYNDVLLKCPVAKSEIGKVGYLSITETNVKANMSQRRSGIHTEKHSSASWGGGGGWGNGSHINNQYTGIFMASTVDNSCRLWNKHIDTPGHMGDCSHLESILGEPTFLEKNELVWMTDSCPHESMPVKKDVYRQWFRFVTSEVNLWYKDYSTENRLGVLPSCRILEGSKFN